MTQSSIIPLLKVPFHPISPHTAAHIQRLHGLAQLLPPVPIAIAYVPKVDRLYPEHTQLLLQARVAHLLEHGMAQQLAHRRSFAWTQQHALLGDLVQVVGEALARVDATRLQRQPQLLGIRRLVDDQVLLVRTRAAVQQRRLVAADLLRQHQRRLHVRKRFDAVAQLAHRHAHAIHVRLLVVAQQVLLEQFGRQPVETLLVI